MTEPRIIDDNSALDLAITLRLGEKPGDFIVLCLDGQVMKGFGTPFDTLNNRHLAEMRVERLNDRSSHSWWPEFFASWKQNLTDQFSLPADATAESFRPVCSWAIHRVCTGWSQRLFTAIQLFDADHLGSRVESWEIGVGLDGTGAATLEAPSGKVFCRTGKKDLAHLIALAALALLEAEPAPPATAS